MSLDCHKGLRGRDRIVVGLRVPMQSLPITTNIVSSNPLMRGVIDTTICDQVCK